MILAEKEHGFNSPEAEKFRNLIKRENIVLDMKTDAGKKLSEEMQNKYGLSPATIAQYMNEKQQKSLAILKEAERKLESSLSEAGGKTLHKASKKSIKKGNLNVVTEEGVENYTRVIKKNSEDKVKKVGFDGMDPEALEFMQNQFLSSPHIDPLTNVAYLPKSSVAAKLNPAIEAHEVLGHGTKSIQNSDIAKSPIKNLSLFGEDVHPTGKKLGRNYNYKDSIDGMLSTMDSPYYMAREEGANQNVRDFIKKRVSKSDRKALNEYYDQQELANKYTTSISLLRNLGGKKLLGG